MATPTPGSTTVQASTSAIYLGRTRPSGGGVQFTSVALTGSDTNAPSAAVGQVPLLYLHGSGTLFPGEFGDKYTAAIPPSLVYTNGADSNTEWKFAVQGYTGSHVAIKPTDGQTPRSSGARRESFWEGWVDSIAPLQLYLYTEKFLDMTMEWVAAHYPQLAMSKLCVSGNSMGGWGTMTWATRKPLQVAAMYPIQPRVRYSNNVGEISLAHWDTTQAYYSGGSAPPIAAAFGGGSSAEHHDQIAYVSNTANKVPWIGWCIGRNDGYSPFSDHIAMVAAMRAAKRGFAFRWSNAGHGNDGGDLLMNEITATYPYGTFQVGRGYPLFTNHSGDQDPAVDLEGGINIGLKFRNVVESAGSWTCQVTSALGARTVTVEPKSDVFTTTVTPQNITIPAANTWVTVTF